MPSITYNDLIKANEGLKTTAIERFDKRSGKTTSKDYIDVSQRVKAFRRAYPMGFIITNIIDITPDDVTMQTKVGFYNDEGCEVVIASGLAHEDKSASLINKTSHLEVCETSAVGRALGFAGFGIDAGIASADEMKAAIKQQEMHKTNERIKVLKKTAESENSLFDGYDPTGVISTTAARKLAGIIGIISKTDQAWWPQVCEQYGIAKTTQIKQDDYGKIVRAAQARADEISKGARS